jgi:hypothetical protein
MKTKFLLSFVFASSFSFADEIVITPFGDSMTGIGGVVTRLTEICGPVTHSTILNAVQATDALNQIAVLESNPQKQTEFLKSISRGFYLGEVFLDIPEEYAVTVFARGTVNQALPLYRHFPSPVYKDAIIALLQFKSSDKKICVVNKRPVLGNSPLLMDSGVNLYPAR